MKKAKSPMNILSLLGDDDFAARTRIREIDNEVKQDHLRSRIAEEVAKETERQARLRRMKDNKRITRIYKTIADKTRETEPAIRRIQGLPPR